MTEPRWVFVVKALDKSGVLTATASIFSNRGVSLEAILGSGIAATTTEDARLILSFRSSERKQEMLLRALGRLSAVLSVDVYAYDDPRLRAIAVAKLTTSEVLNDFSSPVQQEVISETQDSITLLLTGSTSNVERLITHLRTKSVLLDVVVAAIAA